MTRFLHRSVLFVMPLAFLSCKSEQDKWEKSPGVEVSVYKDLENGKPYLTVLYENFGQDTIEKLKYELINETHGHFDTVIKEIDPPVLFRPKDRHSVPRHIGEDTVKAEYVHAGKVWVVKKK